jgi:hypothetical protein
MENSILGRLIRLVVKIPSEMLGVLCDLTEKLASNRGSEWFEALKRFLREGPITVTEEVQEVKVYLRRLFTFRLDAIKEEDFQCPEKVFLAYLDPEFAKQGISFSGPAPETDMVAEELVCDGEFPDFIGSTAKELEKRRIMGVQLLKLCSKKKYRNRLNAKCQVNFAVLTPGNKPCLEDLSNVFVALVSVTSDGLHARLYHVSGVNHLLGSLGHRFFFPQRAA